jgi:Acetyl-CoA carboxylase, central region
MTSTLKDLIGVLHDPGLPYSETTTILSTLSERLPARLEDNIRAAIDAVKTKGTRQEFPAVLVCRLNPSFSHVHSSLRCYFVRSSTLVSLKAEKY